MSSASVSSGLERSIAPARRGRVSSDRGLGGDQVEGRQAVRELLIAGRRKVREVWMLDQGDDSPILEDIRELAAANRVTVNRVGKGRFCAQARCEAPQGVLALAAPLPETDLDSLLSGGGLLLLAGAPPPSEPDLLVDLSLDQQVALRLLEQHPQLRIGSAASILERERAGLPELPEQVKARWSQEGLSDEALSTLTAHPAYVRFVEAVRAACPSVSLKKIANFVQTEVLRGAVLSGLSARFGVSAEQLAELLELVERGAISGKQGKEVFAEMQDTHERPAEIVKQKGMAKNSDGGAIEAILVQLIADNPTRRPNSPSPNVSFNAACAAWKPHMPCTPPPGGVDDEQR